MLGSRMTAEGEGRCTELESLKVQCAGREYSHQSVPLQQLSCTVIFKEALKTGCQLGSIK